MEVEKLYEALLRYYRSATLWGDPRGKLEGDIAKLMKGGLSREDAIKRLFEEKIGDYKLVEALSEGRLPPLEGVKVVYTGERFGIAYVETDPFYDNLPKLGRALDEIEKKYGEVVAVVFNVGLVSTSVFLGTGFQGVKGVAVIFRVRESPKE